MFWYGVLFAKRNSRTLPVAAAQVAGFARPRRDFHPDRRQMDTRPTPLQDLPLIAVVGCTGTGKTKLGVRLAKELGGEVVSADSIQVYRGLNVATNKATEEETEGIPHHIMGTVDWDDKCNVHEYRKEALKFIQDIYSRGKIPVVVGGTSYYIESLIYNHLVQRTSGEFGDEPEVGDEDAVDRLSASTFREYAAFRNANDAPTAETVDGAGRMYADALAEAVRFARTVPAVGRLPSKRYRCTFATALDGGDRDERRWPSACTAAEMETAALYAHGVRLLDRLTAARRDGLRPSTADEIRVGDYGVTAADVAAGRRDGHARADVADRLDALLAPADDGSPPSDGFREALCRAHDELNKRVQRLALALCIDDERTAVDLMTPEALKSHAAYFDPVSANELHPHNTRKLFRIVQIFILEGKKKSKLFQEQRTQMNGSDIPVMTLRFKEVHMMWLTCDVDVLNMRLEKRTDEMVKRGLVDELCKFKKELAEKTDINKLDFTKGVLQCIGLKQFESYLQLPDDERDTDEGRKALNEALDAMKCVTKKYAKRQTRWINNRFLKSHDKQPVSVYRLDCTDLANWPRLSDQAVELAQVVLGRKPRTEHTITPVEIVVQKTDDLPVYGEYYCHGCSRIFSSDIQFNIHMSSKKHERVMKKRKRKLQDTTVQSVGDNEDKLKSHKKS